MDRTSKARVCADPRRRTRSRKRSLAFTLIELLIVIETIMVLAAMALPSIKVSRKAADETSAVACLRQLSDAQELYRPRQNPPCYAPSLQRLRAAGLVDETVANGSKSGYDFMVNGVPGVNTYAFTATASMQGNSGDRSFYVDQSGIIRMEVDASVSSISPPLQ
ncbi:MAG TPA: type II secretion system protein [Armatimonadota bacterium]|jgi:type II secretory pathway pseudopilin PulG